MNGETLFVFVNLLPVPFWFLMIALPHWRGTQRVMARRVALMPLLAIYAVLVLPQLSRLLVALPTTLDELARLLGNPEVALAAWVHFLAFDLFVGRWIYRDSQQRSISAWIMAPILLVAFLLGPLGLLAYLLLRTQFSPKPTS